ncbi:hypothetical protein HPO96_35110 [Kribbella sandramycini]|uniref:Uncharacterized protein n=1 Tax=Kribbella sandramycini TaxID=60450 RepID=A0A7Y4L6V0_9ACTN|nr:hypothetical protein [Kribbella sandramycini]MBB6566704.1 hypothetical protein [Kribbella sandramycini]NOL45490.1 hypothetical protein [Kribbella sandramycini]
MQGTKASEEQRVRVWYGKFAFVDRRMAPERAESFAAAMAHRFKGQPVTLNPADQPDSAPGPDPRWLYLPERRRNSR